VAEIRAVGPDDAALLRELRRRALTTDPDAFAAGVADADEAWAARACAADDDAGAVLIALHDDAPIGMAGVRWPGDDHRIAALWGLWVDPAARGTGAGRELVAGVRAWVRDRGGRFVRLGVFAGERDGGAEAFYARLGFVVVDDFPWQRDPSRRVVRMVRPA
jgi:GNAT superfamily N-acetyltransferase